MTTIISRYSSNALVEVDLTKVILYLRGKYSFTDNLQIFLGDNKRKMCNGKALPNQIYLNLAYITDVENLFKTLAHEFVHVIQMHVGKLGWSDDGNLTWRGKSRQSWIDNPILSPWELEAVLEEINFKKELDKFIPAS